ncbi:MAG: cation-transporting P-type ATPase [Chloroflexi bacterium]|nr:cation-transporting P-type ATPase [Chloroflexota bacterium]
MVKRLAALPVDQLYTALDSSPQGLEPRQLSALRERYGPNTIREVKGCPLIIRFLSQFTHLMAIMLWVAGIAAVIGKMPELAVAIWVVVIINGVFSFWQEFRADKAAEALKNMMPLQARVLRGGEEARISAEELMPGDLLLLSEGDRISADARVLQESELSVDQSTLTGESHPVRKTADALQRSDLARHEMPNLVFAGTNVASGTGKVLVYATGMNSEFGRIAGLTQSVREELSPLQREVQRATRIVLAIAISIGLVFFVLALFVAKVTLIESFIFMMGMSVAFVPEGMLPLVTLSLAMGVQRMAKRNALVKKLSSVETLGCTTVICTDKTGTLTQNAMTVRSLWAAGRRVNVSGGGYVPEGSFDVAGTPLELSHEEDLRELLRAGSLCNNARLVPPSTPGTAWSILGDPTEGALLVSAQKAGILLDTELAAAPRVRELPFDSRRKRMTTLHQRGRELVAYTKGAPAEVLALCTHILQGGKRVPLDDEQRRAIMAANDDYARAGLRVLAVTHRDLHDGTSAQPPLNSWSTELTEQDLTFLGLQAMMDPPRPEVAEAVERCHHAGIRIIMITGDYGLTAANIAQRIGIVSSPQARIITGLDLESITDDELKQALASEVIFARVAPEHKLRVVKNLQELGHVVAVTGDGVNDAPALKKADIGVAMGITGTDVAKEAATMVLSDDNFASIVNAVEEGRAVYANIKKFCTYIFTSNTPEAYPFILYVLSGGRIPLGMTIMQVLAVDLGTDMVPALGLGAELPEPGLMDRPPRNLQEHVISGPLLVRAFLFLGTFQSLAALGAFFFHYWTHGYPVGQFLGLPDSGNIYVVATTMTLAATVMTQIGNLFAQRTTLMSAFRVPLFNNRLLWVGIVTEVLMLLALSYIPALNGIFNTGPLPPENIPFLIALIPLLFVVDEIRKAIQRRHNRRTIRR